MQQLLFEEEDGIKRVRIPGPISHETRLAWGGKPAGESSHKKKFKDRAEAAEERVTSDEERAWDAYLAIPAGFIHRHARRAALDKVLAARAASETRRRQSLSSFPY